MDYQTRSRRDYSHTISAKQPNLYLDIDLWFKDEINLRKDGTFNVRKSSQEDELKIESGGRHRNRTAAVEEDLWTRVDWYWHPFGRRLVHKM